jgi:hypothetical protein
MQQNIDFGTFPDDPNADAIRVAFQKVQTNLTELYAGQAAGPVVTINRPSTTIWPAGAGISVNQSTGNVIVTANISNLQFDSDQLVLTKSSGSVGPTGVVITQSTQILEINLPYNLDIAGNITAGGHVTVNSTENANISAPISNANLYGALRVAGGMGINKDIYVGGNANISNIGTPGLIVAVGNITGGNLVTSGVANVTGNVIGGNITTAGQVVAVSTVTGGNLITAGNLSVGKDATITGNAGIAGNVLISNTNISTGTTSGALVVSGGVGIAGNIWIGGALGFSGPLLVTNTTDSTSITTGALIVGNGANGGAGIAGNAYIGGLVSVASTAISTSATTGALIVAGGAGIAGNAYIGANTYIGGNANITGRANILSTTESTSTTTGALVVGVDTSSNLGGAGIVGNIYVGGFGRFPNSNVSTSTITGVVTVAGGVGIGGNTYIGGNANITGNTYIISNTAATSSVLLSPAALRVDGGVSIGGNIYLAGLGRFQNVTNSTSTVTGAVTVDGGVGILGNIFIGQNANITGNIHANGNITAALQLVSEQITGVAPIQVVSTTRVANLYVQGANEANIQLTTAGVNYLNFTTGTSGNLVLGANSVFYVNAGNSMMYSPKVNTQLLTAGSTGAAGVITGAWTLSAGSVLQATYADLAEYYSADAAYEPGTVLQFGGNNEVTMANSVASTLVAGIVTTKPAHIMNVGIVSEYPVAIALQGRVPVKVTGKVNRGDLMVSSNNGYACSGTKWNIKFGTVLGKAIENFSGVTGVIEIMVGKY